MTFKYSECYTVQNTQRELNMARSGITYLDVAKTAIKLTEQKIYPTIEEVRKSLGTGSNSTINKYLREWRSKHGNQAELEQGLPESLLMAVRGIYDGIQETATNKISLLERESKDAITDLKTKLAIAETEHTKFIQANKSLEHAMQGKIEENLALQRQLSKLELELNKKTETNTIIQESLSDKKVEIENLNKQLKHAQHNLDHYRETTRQMREVENNLLNEKIKNLEKQLYQQQVELSKSIAQITELSHQIKALEDTKQSILQDLNTTLVTLQEQKHVVQVKIAAYGEISEKYNSIISDKLQLANELNAKTAAMLSLRISLEKAQEHVRMLECALEKSETKVTVTSDKNLFLTQEKTELSFQLKQLQANGRIKQLV